MPSPTSKVNISELDFDAIKAALKAYLSSQEQFTDYNFEGSGLTVLMNLLSYNTHYLSYYLNMIANEMYLDSADKRANIVSIAKELGYTPRSRKAATAVVNLTVTPPGTPPPPATLTIEKNTKFNTSISGKTYTFVTERTSTVNLDETNKYVANGVVLREGTPYTYKYTVNTSTPERYVIPNAGVDTGTLVVRVQESAQNNTITVFTLADDVNELSGTSAVYFLQEIEDGKYEVYFGDGVLGKALVDGNIVYIDYLNCNADEPNYANIFTLASTISGYTNVSITTATAAYGGAEREETESIRFSATKNFERQRRAVTVEDYKSLIKDQYPNVQSLAVWGGEDEVPPQYGKVFISMKPVAGYALTSVAKAAIISDILNKQNIVSVIPEIKDPDYVYLLVVTTVRYNAEETTRSANDIKALVTTAIQNFAMTDVGQFDRVFRYSKLVRTIDLVEPSITNNLTTIFVERQFTPRLNAVDRYTIIFPTGIIPGSLTSSDFTDTLDNSYVSGDKYYLDDDGVGIVRTYKYVNAVKTYTKTNCGTVDYVNGIVLLPQFRPSDVGTTNKALKVTCKPSTNDVFPVRNNIVVINNADITVSMVANTPIIV